MADITASQIYPSIKYITTNTKGDLQEITGTDATTASGSLQGITLSSVATGASANGTIFQITQNKPADEILYISATNTIGLRLENSASLYKLNERASDTSGTPTWTTDDKLIIVTTGTISGSDSGGSTATFNVTAGDVFDIASVSSSGKPVIHENNNTAEPTLELFNSGYGSEYGRMIESISNIIATAGTDVTDIATIAISGADSDNLTGSASVTLQGADDATDGELQGNSEYVLIARGDLHSLDSDETTDGRKLLWGLLEKYSDAYYALDSANRPESLTLNKSNFLTQTDGHSLKQTYTVTASYDVNGLDLLAE